MKNKIFISLSCIASFLFIFNTKADAEVNQPVAPEVETTIIQELNELYQKKVYRADNTRIGDRSTKFCRKING
ncbi:hypothetical protein [Enterococcus faecalis]|uniref:hypothetical protein n=1 Tax=Enterococcus faecalis TaxID=1351 RepID=UPI00404220E0